MSSLQLWSCSGLCWGCWHGVHCQGTRACWSSLGNTMMLLHGRESRVRLGSPSPAKESPSPSPSTVLFVLHPALSGFCRSKPHLCHCSSEEMQLPAPPAPSWLASRCVPGSQTSPPQSLLARIILGVLPCPGCFPCLCPRQEKTQLFSSPIHPLHEANFPAPNQRSIQEGPAEVAWKPSSKRARAEEGGKEQGRDSLSRLTCPRHGAVHRVDREGPQGP